MSTVGSKKVPVESADSKNNLNYVPLGVRNSGLQPPDIGKIGESFHSYDSNPRAMSNHGSRIGNHSARRS